MCFLLLRLYLWFPKAWLRKDFSLCLCGNLLLLVLSALDLWCDVWHESRVFRGIIVLNNALSNVPQHACCTFCNVPLFLCALSMFVSLSFSQLSMPFTIPTRLETLFCPVQTCNEPLEAVCISTRVYLGLGILFAFFSRNCVLQFTLSSVLACYVLFLLKMCF